MARKNQRQRGNESTMYFLRNTIRSNTYILYILFLSMGAAIFLFCLSGCAGKQTTLSPQKDKKNTDESTDQSRAEMEERIIGSPMLITSDYFRKTTGEGKPLRLFGDSKREKKLEERLARLEQRLKGLPERGKGPGGLPVLRRKVVMLSLLGDLGLDVLSLLPSSLRHTNGLVPVDASHLSRLLNDHGYTVSDLASASVRREIAWAAGIQAYLLVYFPQAPRIEAGKSKALRIDLIHATESVLIGSYLATVDEFDKIAPKISADAVRATEWSCRVVEAQDGAVYLNAGRLTGLQPGDRLNVYGQGKELVDPITHRSLGYAPGKLKGMIEIRNLFGTDAAQASVVSGSGFHQGDIVKMAELAG